MESDTIEQSVTKICNSIFQIRYVSSTQIRLATLLISNVTKSTVFELQ